MCRCWEHKPKHRPTFEELENEIDSLLRNETHQMMMRSQRTAMHASDQPAIDHPLSTLRKDASETLFYYNEMAEERGIEIERERIIMMGEGEEIVYAVLIVTWGTQLLLVRSRLTRMSRKGISLEASGGLQ